MESSLTEVRNIVIRMSRKMNIIYMKYMAKIKLMVHLVMKFEALIQYKNPM